MAVAKLCRSPGCEDLAEPGQPYCTDCGKIRAAREAARKQAAKRASAAWSHLYQTSWWRRESKAFRRAHPLCAHCAEIGLVVPATEVDHIEPHRGDLALFRDKRNWQALCHTCHSRKTAREVLSAKGEGGGFSSKGCP